MATSSKKPVAKKSALKSTKKPAAKKVAKKSTKRPAARKATKIAPAVNPVANEVVEGTDVSVDNSSF